MCVKLNRSLSNRHLGIWPPSWFHFIWNSYIWIWGLLQHTFLNKYELCSAKQRDYRQHNIIPDSHFKFWTPSWIPIKMELASHDSCKAVHIANISWKLHACIRKLNIVIQNKIFDRLHRSILVRHGAVHKVCHAPRGEGVWESVTVCDRGRGVKIMWRHTVSFFTIYNLMFYLIFYHT